MSPKSKSVADKGFSSSVFDYRSAFEYGSQNETMKSFPRGCYNSAFSYHPVILTTEEEDLIKESRLFGIIRNVITFAVYVLTVCLFPFSVWICIKKVHSLERIVSMRLGRLQPIHGPGIAVILPFIDEWFRVDLRPQTFNLSSPKLLTADGAIVETETEIQYQVCNVVHYVTRLNQQEQTLKELCLRCLVNLVSEKDQEDLENHRELLSFALKEELNRTITSWGLEILNVCLLPVIVLKAAEPVNAINTLMYAIQAATGQSSEHTAATFPFVPPKSDVPADPVATEEVEITVDDVDLVDEIRKHADIASNKGRLHDISATFKLEIVGRTTRIVFCCFENGRASVFEDSSSLMEPNVTVMLTEDNLRDFLAAKMSPVQAYLDGKVMVTGDWSLLRPLAKLFE